MEQENIKVMIINIMDFGKMDQSEVLELKSNKQKMVNSRPMRVCLQMVYIMEWGGYKWEMVLISMEISDRITNTEKFFAMIV